MAIICESVTFHLFVYLDQSLGLFSSDTAMLNNKCLSWYLMKIALIAPPFPLEEAPSPPLGLCYVAAVFKAAGAEVAFFDYIVEQYSKESLAKKLDAFQPDAVGITSVTMNFKGAAQIIKDVKAYNPNIVTVFGGPHVTFDAPDTLNKYPEVDIVALGEAELTIVELTPVITQRDKWKDVEGIAFLNADKKLINNGRREFIKELDTLPLPARELLPIARYRALGFPVSIITSRGCPYKCIFCQGTRMVGHKIRYRNTMAIADEIEGILALGFPRINIADDFFTSSRKQVKLLCEEIKRRHLNFSWSAFARVNSVSHELLEVMMDAGCDAISFGIESGNQEMLDRVEKHMKLEQVTKAVQICKDVGMHVFSSFIVGLPGETPETLKETNEFARSLGTDFGYHFLAPLPGTPVRDNVKAYDVNILSTDWNDYDANKAIVSTSSLSADDMNAFVAEFDEACNDIFAANEQAYKTGEGTPDQIASYENKVRMEYTYKMLSENLMERFSQNLVIQPGTTIEDELALSLKQGADVELDILKKIIANLVKQGNIDCVQQGNTVSWFWPQYPKLVAAPQQAIA